jgi:predicted GNAT family acetyltransferase
MRVTTPEPAEFERRATELLCADEARHNLILGLLDALRRHPTLYPDHALWLAEDDDGAVAGAALRTRPLRLVLAQPRRPEALDALAAAIDEDLPGVVGAVPEVERFARAWAERRSVAASVSMAQGVYALDRVVPPPAPGGGARAATEADRPLLLDWMRAFTREALGEREPDEERLAQLVDHRLAADEAGFVLWQTDAPVSLAGYGGLTPTGARIGPVYTPPEQRGRGYGAAVTAAVSAERLAAGRRFCFLYTDLANPTSNSIYARIGYRRVCDSLELDFRPRWLRSTRPSQRTAATDSSARSTSSGVAVCSPKTQLVRISSRAP